jgi:hypothetical protein
VTQPLRAHVAEWIGRRLESALAAGSTVSDTENKSSRHVRVALHHVSLWRTAQISTLSEADSL